MYQIRSIDGKHVWVDNLDMQRLEMLYYDGVINALGSQISFISCYKEMVDNYPVSKELILQSLKPCFTIFDNKSNTDVTHIFGSNIKDDGTYYSVRADFVGFHGHHIRKYMEDHIEFVNNNNRRLIRVYDPGLYTQARRVIGDKFISTPKDGIINSSYTPPTPNRLVLNEDSFDKLLSKLKDKHSFFNYDF
ncbi:hypothetical protein [Proteus phage 3H10_20]|uniref:Uncharacterized protein n=1 Tax=Proteus phage 3H10_20 TaxID=2772448 RepID=A0A7L7SSN9_9CAUD|nr:hypothetical protein PQC37_gp072 [Proteus phage 3H10_20]QOC54858.1 hypothetical protein [Proteus phage 3H10_20]